MVGALTLHRVRLPYIEPLDPSNLIGHLAATAVPGVEEYRDGRYRSTVRLASGPAIVSLSVPRDGAVDAELWLTDDGDLDEAVSRSRAALGLDVDPGPVAAVLTADPVLRPLVAAAPGRRVPGTLDGEALAIRAVLGQQVSTAAARTHAARLVAALGDTVTDPAGSLTRLFPPAKEIAANSDDLDRIIRMPSARRSTVVGLAHRLADGTVDLADHESVRRSLRGVPGIGPWTIGTIAMRAAGDPDAFLPGDLGVRQAAARLGLPTSPGALDRRSAAWSPHRATAVQYLWATGAHAVNTLPPG